MPPLALAPMSPWSRVECLLPPRIPVPALQEFSHLTTPTPTFPPSSAWPGQTQLSSCYKLLVIISVLGGTLLGKNLARYSGISYGLSSGTWIHYICQFLPSPGSGSGSVLRVQFSVSVTPGVIDDWELSFAHHPSRRRTVKGGLRKRLRLQLL